MTDFSELKGRVLCEISIIGNDEIIFGAADGSRYKLYHEQDCCEHVCIESIVGEVSDLLNTPILLAEEATNVSTPDAGSAYESETWTFYKLRTIKGSVDIRWYGASNGHYSKRVDFCKMSADLPTAQ